MGIPHVLEAFMSMLAQPDVICAAAILAQVSARCHLWRRLEGRLSGTACFLSSWPVLQPCRAGEEDTVDELAPGASSTSVPVMVVGATLVAGATGVVDLAADAIESIAMAGAVMDEEPETTRRQIMLCPSSW